MIIEVMVIGDEKVEKIDFFQKVAGVILDFMATIWGHGNGFFRRRKNLKKSGFQNVVPIISGDQIVVYEVRELVKTSFGRFLKKLKKSVGFFNCLEKT